ncbi:aspartate carbamoyltransferase [Candidatus Roizmanbacteria bacterium]|nr:aspartate carbamoyltransferase [Candidatus Roizmanbacteria bacterium]
MLTKISTKNTLKQKDILSLDQFDIKTLSMIFKIADTIKKRFKNKKTLEILKGKVITLLFFEPSSRTFSSFCAAAKRLGAQTIEYQNPMQTSSAVKGETLEDSIKVFSTYSDLIVIRHPEIGAAKRAADTTDIPVINAGDGSGEHPTQALLDLYTIQKRCGTLTGLTGLIAGDLLYGRTVHSLLRGLSLYSENTVYLLSPRKLNLTRELFEKISKKINLIEIADEKQIPNNCDFWYWTRVQKERFSNLKEYEKIKHSFVMTPELLAKKGGKNTIIMHPLPRVGEIDTRIDKDPRALYLRDQIQNGLYVRMALLELVLK